MVMVCKKDDVYAERVYGDNSGGCGWSAVDGRGSIQERGMAVGLCTAEVCSSSFGSGLGESY